MNMAAPTPEPQGVPIKTMLQILDEVIAEDSSAVQAMYLRGDTSPDTMLRMGEQIEKAAKRSDALMRDPAMAKLCNTTATAALAMYADPRIPTGQKQDAIARSVGQAIDTWTRASERYMQQFGAPPTTP